jgi:hypothetical protein
VSEPALTPSWLAMVFCIVLALRVEDNADAASAADPCCVNETTAVVAVVSGVDTATLEPVTEESEVVSADVSAASWLESVARLSVPDGDRTTTKVMT